MRMTPQSKSQLLAVLEDTARSKTEWKHAAHQARAELAEIRVGTQKAITTSRELMAKVDDILKRR
jgi:hypothetical protein